MPTSIAIAAVSAGVSSALTGVAFMSLFATNLVLAGLSSALPHDGV